MQQDAHLTRTYFSIIFFYNTQTTAASNDKHGNPFHAILPHC